MRFAAIYFFISPARRTNAMLDIFDEPKEKALLLFPRPLTNRAIDTGLRQLLVFFTNGCGAQVFPLIYY